MKHSDPWLTDGGKNPSSMTPFGPYGSLLLGMASLATITCRHRSTRASGVQCLVLGLLLGGIACGDDGGTGPDGDTTPPSSVQDLLVIGIDRQDVELSWTAPGDNGLEGRAAQYDLRVSELELTEDNFEASDRIVVPRLPRAAGSAETLVVTVGGTGLRYFSLKTADEVPNWSPMSNVVSAEIEVVAPDPVNDLAAATIFGGSVVLTWTAPDGGDGLAADEYDLRYLVGLLTEETWGDAVAVEDESLPLAPGAIEEHVVAGLQPNTEYSFGIKSSSGAAISSSLSNVVVAQTLAQVRLTFSTERTGAADPAWAPQGGRIAFHQAILSESTLPDLYLIDEDGSDAMPIAYGNLEGAQSPVWAPSGTELAFVGFEGPVGSVRTFIAVGSPSGGEARKVADHGDLVVASPSWSPDGRELVYEVRVSVAPLVTEVFRVDAQGGSAPIMLLDGTVSGSQAAWSPDGSQIAFWSARSGQDIWVVPAGGGEPARVTDDPSSDQSPAWSPDGQRIAFVSDRGGTMDIWVMDADGSNPVQVTSDDTNERNPSWSPDGTALTYHASGSNNIGDVWTVHLPE